MDKEEVLELLKQTKDTGIRGQELAQRLGVSRTAVWKMVEALRKDGYEIKGIPNIGYFLQENSDVLEEKTILNGLDVKMPVFVLPVIDSTNTEAKRRINEGLCGPALFVAETQTAGRGRLGRSFYAPKKTGAYFSLAYPVQTSFSSAVSVTARTAVAVAEGLEALTKHSVDIKWVNDVYYKGKKICGILTEAVSDFEQQIVQYVVIGIGINLSTENFPEELQNKAGSLEEKNLTRNQVIIEVVNRLLGQLTQLGNKGYLDSYRSHSCVIGQEVTYKQGDVWKIGQALDIDEDGGLVVETPDGSLEVLNSGEITLRVQKPLVNS